LFVEQAIIYDARIRCGAAAALCRRLKKTGTTDSAENAEKMICVLSELSG